MRSDRCSLKNCGNTVTTTRGTYTFYSERIKKTEAAKLCKKHGGIIAPLNTKEEFDAVHKFAYKCQPWCVSYHHVGLYVHKNETRFYSDCTEWDWNKHDKLYKSYTDEAPCWETTYRPKDKIQKIWPLNFCNDHLMRTICFNPNEEISDKKTKPEEFRQVNYAGSFNTFIVLSVVIALASLVIVLAIALKRSMNKNKTHKNKLSLLVE